MLGTVSNSCVMPSMRTEEIAAPGSELSSTRLMLLPKITPKPFSTGSTTNLP